MPRARTGFARTAAPVGVAVLLAVVGPALAQQDPADTFSEAIEVSLIDLQVVVTDADGRRMHGLPPEAFRVLVNGDEAPIELFTEVGGGAAADLAGPGSAAGPRVPVNYLVFVDDLMTLEAHRDVVLQNLLVELDGLLPGDRMAIVRLARKRKLQVLSGWTSDRKALAEALRVAMDLPSWGIKYFALRRMEDYVANWEGNDSRRAVLAAAASMRLLPRPEGRRVMLLVAGSWDPAEVDRASLFSPWCVTGWCQGVGVYNVLTDTANLFGYAIYAVDVEGRDLDRNWSREKRLQEILGELARVTGGKRLLNQERLRVLSTAVEDTRSYYSIGVAAPPGAPEARLRVEIEMLRPGLEARSQTAFVPLSPERDRQLDVLNALWLEEGATDGPVKLHLGQPRRLGGGRVAIPALVSVASRGLEWREEAGARFADISLELAAVDLRGNSSEVESRRVRLRLSADDSDHDELVFLWPLELRRRRHTIVAGLHDHLGGRSHVDVGEIAPRDTPQPRSAPSGAGQGH